MKKTNENKQSQNVKNCGGSKKNCGSKNSEKNTKNCK